VIASHVDELAYLFALVGLYVMVGGLFFYGFWHKAIDGDFEIAPPLEEQFEQHESVATLYGYFGATLIIMLFVRTLPPYTSNRWLS
jgi:hypothetical protein